MPLTRSKSAAIVVVHSTIATTGPFEEKGVSGEKKKRNRNLLHYLLLVNPFLTETVEDTTEEKRN